MSSTVQLIKSNPIRFVSSQEMYVHVNSSVLSRALKVLQVSADLADYDSEFQRVDAATGNIDLYLRKKYKQWMTLQLMSGRLKELKSPYRLVIVNR